MSLLLQRRFETAIKCHQVGKAGGGRDDDIQPKFGARSSIDSVADADLHLHWKQQNVWDSGGPGTLLKK